MNKTRLNCNTVILVDTDKGSVPLVWPPTEKGTGRKQQSPTSRPFSIVFGVAACLLRILLFPRVSLEAEMGWGNIAPVARTLR